MNLTLPHLVLAVTTDLHPPPALTLSPRYIFSLTVSTLLHGFSFYSTATPIFASNFMLAFCLQNFVVTLFILSSELCGHSLHSVFRTLWSLSSFFLQNFVVTLFILSSELCGHSLHSVFRTLWSLSHSFFRTLWSLSSFCLQNFVVTLFILSSELCGHSLHSFFRTLWSLSSFCLQNFVVTLFILSSELYGHSLHSGTSPVDPLTALCAQNLVNLHSQDAGTTWVNFTFTHTILCDVCQILAVKSLLFSELIPDFLNCFTHQD